VVILNLAPPLRLLGLLVGADKPRQS